MIWRPFELRPEGTPPKDRAYLENAFNNWVLPMAKELGVEMKLPAHQPLTRLAHEAAAFARAIGKGAELADGLFKAYWIESRDIGAVEVLCDIALNAGIDPVEMRGALEGRSQRDQVEGELRLAQQYRITGVPFFIFDGKYAASGLQREEQLRRAIAMCRGEGLVQLEE